MDHHDIFYQLEKYEKDNDFDLSSEENEKIKKICESLNDITINNQHLQKILYLLNHLSVDVLSKSETFMSLKQYRVVKFVIEKAVTIGIVPCLLPGVAFNRTQSQLTSENLSDMVKYNRLSSTIRTLVDCHDEIALKPAIQTQLSIILGGLLQLSYAPLIPPTKLPPENPSKFHMTEEIYKKLTQDHKEFTEKLDKLVKNCQLSDIMREMFVYSGSKNVPSWLRKHAKNYIIESIMQPIGIASLFKIDGITNTSKNKIDIITKLIINSHGQDIDKYFTSVCSQILDFLKYKNSNNSFDIFSIFIINLYDYYPDICKDKIINIIIKPLTTKIIINDENLILQNENNISLCIENLYKCFTINNDKFRNLFCKLIKHITVPLFYMFIKIQNSILLVKTKVKKILIKLLNNNNLTDDLFKIYLKIDDDDDDDNADNNKNIFGDKLTFKIGSSGGLQIISKIENIEYEKIVNCLYDIVSNDDDLLNLLFHYLLKSLIDNNLIEKKIKNQELYLNKKMELLKLLTKISYNKNIQKEQVENPKNILNFIKLLINNIIKYNNDNDHEILYVSLMLIKLILEEEKPNDWQPFDEFLNYLITTTKNINNYDNISTIINDLTNVIKNRGIKLSNNNINININDKKQKEFDEALNDTNDPLLPVRAHGLMILTKKIESSDSIAIAKKDLLLSIFQKNLTDDDSYIYQIAINGLCALSSKYPNELIEVLVNVFIDLPNNSNENIITPENRVKLGEILIKTIRKIGEKSYLYKNILINGFLRGTCDNDYIIRASSLSCIGELCQILGCRLGNEIKLILSHIENIITNDKSPEVRRAAVMVTTLLLRGLGEDAIVELGQDLLPLYRGIKYLQDNDTDEVLRLHAQLTLAEFDKIVHKFIFSINQ